MVSPNVWMGFITTAWWLSTVRRRARAVPRRSTGLKLDYGPVLLEFAAKQVYRLNMRSAHPNRRPAKANKAGREAGYERKQRWTAKPGNLETDKELRLISSTLCP